MAKPNGRSPRQRVGAIVRTVREERGLTLEALASQAGLSPSHMSRIERGHTMPSYDVLARVAAALGSDLTTLTAEEQATKTVDTTLDAILDRRGVSTEARADLLRLNPSTRAELAQALAHDREVAPNANSGCDAVRARPQRAREAAGA